MLKFTCLQLGGYLVTEMAVISENKRNTILTEMMADEFNSLRPEIKNYKAEADADLIPIPGQLELHGRCRYGILLSPCFGALFVADLIAGVEELELHYRRRGRYNFRKIKIATISIRMVVGFMTGHYSQIFVFRVVTFWPE